MFQAESLPVLYLPVPAPPVLLVEILLLAVVGMLPVADTPLLAVVGMLPEADMLLLAVAEVLVLLAHVVVESVALVLLRVVLPLVAELVLPRAVLPLVAESVELVAYFHLLEVVHLLHYCLLNPFL